MWADEAVGVQGNHAGGQRGGRVVGGGRVDTDEIAAELNRLGSLGWELVSTSERLSKGDTDATLLLFKREVLS